MPRIGMLIARFYPVGGGAEIHCRKLAIELKRLGFPVFVLTQKIARAPRFQTLDDIPVYRIGPSIGNRFGSFYYVVSGLARLLLKRGDYDVLHAHLASSPAVLAALVSAVTKVPAILMIAGSRKTGDVGTSSRTWYGRLKLKFLQNRFNYIVSPSREAKDEIVNAGFPANKVIIIPNGVRTDIFAPVQDTEKHTLRKGLGLSETGPLVLYTGRLEPGKGIETLVDAWGLLPKDDGARLVILGTGSLEGSLKSRASGDERIVFPGWKENAADYVKAADIFVLPSFGEGLPNSLLEAMSCGLACVSTRIGGVTELIRNGENGVLVKPGEPESLAGELKMLMNDPAARERLGKAARSFVENNMSMEKVAARYAELYRKLIDRSGEIE